MSMDPPSSTEHPYLHPHTQQQPCLPSGGILNFLSLKLSPASSPLLYLLFLFLLVLWTDDWTHCFSGGGATAAAAHGLGSHPRLGSDSDGGRCGQSTAVLRCARRCGANELSRCGSPASVCWVGAAVRRQRAGLMWWHGAGVLPRHGGTLRRQLCGTLQAVRAAPAVVAAWWCGVEVVPTVIQQRNGRTYGDATRNGRSCTVVRHGDGRSFFYAQKSFSVSVRTTSPPLNQHFQYQVM